jgi:hypothetical protein
MATSILHALNIVILSSPAVKSNLSSLGRIVSRFAAAGFTPHFFIHKINFERFFSSEGAKTKIRPASSGPQAR